MLKNRFLRPFLAATVAVAIIVALCPGNAAIAQQNPTPQGFTLTYVGQRLPSLPMSNTTSSCSITFYSGSGSITAQASSDNGASWSTATAIGTAGVVNSVGTFSGGIASAGLTTFGGYLSALSSGPVTGSEVCTGASAATVGGIFPTPIPTPSSGIYPVVCGTAVQYCAPTPVATVFVANATTAPFATWVPVTVASAVALTVNTPAPVTPIPWTSASPEPVSCVVVAAVGGCPSPQPRATAAAPNAVYSAPPANLTSVFYNAHGSTAPIECWSPTFKHITSAATTLVLAAGAAGQFYTICGVIASTACTTTCSFYFEQGTQVTNPCDTSTLQLTGATYILSATDSTWTAGFSVVPVTRTTVAASQFCVVSTGTIVGMDFTIMYDLE